ncbi:hypothetical protein QN277_010573 [Acacia crassicarpa]|uniref:Uncharacterized protein n=1 Tax=Acacia crassicarpa TaxID=499986 RepID=A0AAE1IN47_9FABA|nr:hypothetical protein QN277_010573 [Acacia crassicarpa]
MEVPKHRRWISHEVMNQLESLLTSPEYQTKCETSTANQASSKGGGGSIPNVEHKRRMAENLERELSILDLFKKTHYDEKTGQFANHCAAAIHQDFLRQKESINSEGSIIQSNQDEYNLWSVVLGDMNKKGQMNGFGSKNEHIGSSALAPSANSTVDLELQTEITQMREDYATLKQQNEMIMSALQAHGIHLPNLFNPAANNEASFATNAKEDTKNDS